ncbi:hypothetical protein FQZ97_948930 [compost metagenome]
MVPAKVLPARLAMATVVVPMVTLTRSSRPSASLRVKVPVATMLLTPALEPLARPASNTWSLPPWLPGSTLICGPSSLPVMVMVRVAVSRSPSASCIV